MSKIFSLPLMGVGLRIFSSLSYSLPSCSVSKRLHFNSFQHIFCLTVIYHINFLSLVFWVPGKMPGYRKQKMVMQSNTKWENESYMLNDYAWKENVIRKTTEELQYLHHYNPLLITNRSSEFEEIYQTNILWTSRLKKYKPQVIMVGVLYFYMSSLWSENSPWHELFLYLFHAWHNHSILQEHIFTGHNPLSIL